MSAEDEPSHGSVPDRIHALSSLVFDICKAALGVLVVGFLLWGLIAARTGHAIVVEALSVPETAVTKGYTGQVVASRIVDRMTYLARIGNRVLDKKVTAQPPDVPVKVQVSGVGVSIDEAFSYLRSLVSTDTAISGEITMADTESAASKNAKAVILRLRVNLDGATCERQKSTVDDALFAAADCMYRHIQPDRYARYLVNRYLQSLPVNKPEDCGIGNDPAGLADRRVAEGIFEDALRAPLTSAEDRAWAAEGLGHQLEKDAELLECDAEETDSYVKVINRAKLDQAIDGYARAIDDFRMANRLSVLPLARTNLVDAVIALREATVFSSNAHAELGAVRALTQTLELSDSQHVRTLREKWRRFDFYHGISAALLGDYRGAEEWYGRALATCIRNGGLRAADSERCNPEAEIFEDACGDAALRDSSLLRSKCGDTGDRILLVRALAHDATARGQLADLGKLDAVLPADVVHRQWQDILDQCSAEGHVGLCETRDIHKATLALAEAMLGRHAAANSEIAATSRDCDACLRDRGRILALEGNWSGAGAMFWMAQSHAPDLPQSYSEWAEILLDRAVAKGTPRARAHALLALALLNARRAHQIGPDFADADEILGRILLAQGQFANAAEAFDAALRAAPRWQAARSELVAARLAQRRNAVAPMRAPAAG